ncbi:MAG: sugar phosphate isomerase/epimerase [Verrucomicrobia bacterium]|nr:sugar phosphate isomerase/epimerase [Verrucomicrobiota bacterium]
MNTLNRRMFLRGGLSTVAVATMVIPASRLAAARVRSAPIRLGGPIYVKTDDPVELARAHRRLGYGAAYCPDVSLNDSARIRAIADAYAEADVVIAEVGRWVNLLDADPAKRAANLRTVTEGLALADEVGALCCVDIAGSYSKDAWYGPSPDNVSKRFFDEAVENARKIIDAVKPRRAKFCYEMMGWALPDSPESALKILKAVDRKGFGVHLDPCNLINSPTKFYRNTDLLNECFDKLGRWIVSCHAKDLRWNLEMNIHFIEVRPGLGVLDYPTYLRRLSALSHQPPLMMEHLSTAEEYDQARVHIFEVGKQTGIDFG